jgi:transcriptional regulator with XRE-family HTH domain
MAGTSELPDDIGKRIAAARAYAGIDVESLADAISLTPPLVRRIEAGLQDLPEGDQWSMIHAVAGTTRLPEQFFTVEWTTLVGVAPPEDRLAQLERTVAAALVRMDRVVAEAESQMTRGKKQLDRFIEHQAPDRELLRKIAEHLGIPSQ